MRICIYITHFQRTLIFISNQLLIHIVWKLKCHKMTSYVNSVTLFGYSYQLNISE